MTFGGSGFCGASFRSMSEQIIYLGVIRLYITSLARRYIGLVNKIILKSTLHKAKITEKARTLKY